MKWKGGFHMLKWILLYLFAGGIGSFAVLYAVYATMVKDISGRTLKEDLRNYLSTFSWYEAVKWPLYLVIWPILFPIGLYCAMECKKALHDLEKLDEKLE